MEELRKFQSSTFDTLARRKVIEDQDTVVELSGRLQELQNEVNCVNDSEDFHSRTLNRYAVEMLTLPINRDYSLHILLLEDY